MLYKRKENVQALLRWGRVRALGRAERVTAAGTARTPGHAPPWKQDRSRGSLSAAHRCTRSINLFFSWESLQPSLPRTLGLDGCHMRAKPAAGAPRALGQAGGPSAPQAAAPTAASPLAASWAPSRAASLPPSALKASTTTAAAWLPRAAGRCRATRCAGHNNSVPGPKPQAS